ncbi:phosphoribosylglycinamide formyltransferase [Spongiibacter nanhainus]|uniref:Phosphoribosylglycinamide formyltransferase n=1 Tax=Spongiibacter nanhainus TaxID=2794344 RepID=A0A7T4QZQ1_9GAMM|nr:phosphoribosylglycinamide formyltransferase [Spongiibacter nanhainus]QQD17614.1 phosphoribosylglycinamide formyltransferase [Spongiibacter nanhainus]
MTCRIVVLISGSGSNLQSLIDAGQSGELGDADVVAVLSNKPGAYGLERAQQAGIATDCVEHQRFDSREAFDNALRDAIDRHQPDLVILAGFMRILTPDFVRHYRGRLLNIHPSLLPKYPGLHTHQRALDAGDTEAGATVHFVTEELDGGPPIIQAKVPTLPDDSAETLAARVLSKEHRIYPLAARWFAEGRLQLNDSEARLDDKALPPTGWQYSDD